MSDRSDDQESGAGEPKPPKIKAEDNPWYLLATLYGEPNSSEWETYWRLQKKNRITWNRYFSARIPDETRARLVEEKRYSAKELTPFSDEELQGIEEVFTQRSKSLATAIAPPRTDSNPNFKSVEFDRFVDFTGFLFYTCSFQDAVFRDGAAFNKATFRILANFLGATFCDATSFAGATFDEHAEFTRVTFSSRANFDRATFFYVSTFENATFEFAHFIGATFSSYANFSKSTFLRLGCFVNAKMNETTSFAGATFEAKPPEFFGAELHQGTVWRGITWPPKPKDKDEAGRFIDAYACLKLEMDRLKKHEDELDFFSLELQSRRVLLGRWGWGLPIALYGLLSDYGRSYARPFLWLLGVAAIGAMLLVFSDALPIAKSFGLSLANTFNVFGFRKDFFDATTIEPLPATMKTLAAVQTILGTILLFLFGLGIRNKFRMK